MSVPALVEDSLDGEDVAARVSLGGDDELVVTPTRTLIYRSEGLLSDESVDEYPHEAERLTISEGRRKTTLSLEYTLEGTRQFTVPASKQDAVLHPVLAGVLTGNEITEPDETIVNTYRFSELTLILTSERLVKHVGAAVWDQEYEEHHYGDVTNLSFEDGSVATQIVLEVDGRPERIKAPNESAADLRERLKRTLCEYHDVDSLEEFNAQSDDGEEESTSATMDFGEGVEPLDTNSQSSEPETPASTGDGEAAVVGTTGDSELTEVHHAGEQRPAEPDGEPESTTAAESKALAENSVESTNEVLIERIDRLEATVEEQTNLLEQQQETIEQLIDELRRGR